MTNRRYARIVLNLKSYKKLYFKAMIKPYIVVPIQINKTNIELKNK